MAVPSPIIFLRTFCLSILLIFGAWAAQAQATAPAPQGYDFMTVTTIESFKMLLTPAFQGKTEVLLADANLLRLNGKDIEKITQNTLLISQQLSALTVAGWELVQVYPVSPTATVGYAPPIIRYLLRKPKP